MQEAKLATVRTTSIASRSVPTRPRARASCPEILRRISGIATASAAPITGGAQRTNHDRPRRAPNRAARRQNRPSYASTPPRARGRRGERAGGGCAVMAAMRRGVATDVPPRREGMPPAPLDARGRLPCRALPPTVTVLRRLQLTILLVVSIACAWLTAARLHVASDLSALFPESGDAGALARWTRAAGGRDPAVVLVRGPDPESVAGVATDLAEALKNAPSIRRVVDGGPTFRVLADPTLAWAQAGPKARARLAGLVTPEGMRSRLEETRSLLL